MYSILIKIQLTISDSKKDRGWKVPSLMPIRVKYDVYLQDVLAEVPFQVVEYMERNNIPPGVPDVQTALKLHQMQL